MHPGKSEARPGASILFFVKYSRLIELKYSLGQEQRIYLKEAFFSSPCHNYQKAHYVILHDLMHFVHNANDK